MIMFMFFITALLMGAAILLWLRAPTFTPVHAKRAVNVPDRLKSAIRPSPTRAWRYKDGTKSYVSFKGKTGVVVRGMSAAEWSIYDGDFCVGDSAVSGEPPKKGEMVVVRVDNNPRSLGLSLRRVREVRSGVVYFESSEGREDSLKLNALWLRNVRKIV